MVKGALRIYPSPKKFDVSELEFQSTEATQITLSQVDETQAFTIIDVCVKVMSCSELVTLGTRDGAINCNISALLNTRTRLIAMCWKGSEALPIEDLKCVIQSAVDCRCRSNLHHSP